MARSKQRDALVLYPHHRKPYRVHHLASVLIALALILVCAFGLGYTAGNGKQPEAPAPTTSAKPAAPAVVRSGYGFSFTASAYTFTVNGTEAGGQAGAVTGDALKASRPLTSAVVRTVPGAVSGRLAAARLSVKVNPDPEALKAVESQPGNAGLSPEEAAGRLFPVSSSGEVSMHAVSSVNDKLNNVPVRKTVYEFTGNHGGKSYAVVWTGTVKGRAFAVELDGLAGSPAIPTEFANVLASLDIGDGQAVLGATTFGSSSGGKGTLDSKYLSDALSPAVVQIFHTVCGVLTLNGKALGSSDCISFSGSGFLATRDGYIATNGHVVVFTAKDAMAGLIVSNPKILGAYLKGLGLSPAQIKATEKDPAALAALIAKIYDLPDAAIRFSDEGELTLVSLGSSLPDIKKLVHIKKRAQLAGFSHDTGSIKQAQVVGYDYSAKDSYTAVADPEKGFSSSDVALLKVGVVNAPAIPIETGRVVQNEKIVVMGFPGDANNALTDNRTTDVTVTDGVVSSIRKAAGGKGKLYQSDADASHGSSGGPAIDEDGRVIGLLTYRYSSSKNGDSAKSYIRAISDFTKLADDKNVTIDSTSNTQDRWEEGLSLYSKNHYSAALKDFERVKIDYPAQRLVASYISSSKQAIADGKDVKDFPVGVLIAGLAVGVTGLAAAAVVIMRHHAMHRVYRTSVPDAPNPQPVFMATTPGQTQGVQPPAASPAPPTRQQSPPPQPPRPPAAGQTGQG
jgi:S1-C subfamily serine protease